jgi:hypothetical protein
VIEDDLQAWMNGTRDINLTSVVDTSETGLVLFRIDYSSTGDDTLNLWFNPDVTNLGSAATHTGDFLGASGLTRLSAFSYSNTARPIIDNLRLSDDADAFFQVTAIPEPSTLLLLSGALVSLALFRRRR